MRLLVVVGNCRAYYRFVAPIISAMGKGVGKTETTLIAPDVAQFFEREAKPRCALREPVEAINRSTKLMKELRSVLVYLYWAFLDVQYVTILEDKGEKKWFSRPLARFGTFVKPRHILGAGRFLHRIGLNRFFARIVLVFYRLLELLHSPDRYIVDQIKEIAPDVILVTPVIDPMGYDFDYLRAGLGLRIPTVTLIASWDHLTTKGLLTMVSDRVLVWNDIQIREAREYHAVSTDRFVSVGAPVFDRMFEKRLLQPRSDFCKNARLDPHRPFVLWAATSSLGCDDEKVIARQFIQEMRKSRILKEFQVLIRPHPNAAKIWEDWRVEDAPVWSTPGFPNSDEAMRGLYNSIAHSIAVVGLSTSLFLETAILDRPCALIKAAEADKNANFNKFLHFQYLLNSGFPEATEDEADCVRWLAQVAEGRDAGKEARRRLVSSFLRPKGIGRPAAEVAAEVIFATAKSARKRRPV